MVSNMHSIPMGTARTAGKLYQPGHGLPSTGKGSFALVILFHAALPLQPETAWFR
ncbi:hypothetical protein [Escherichia coli]|uniref:hypothetical protein n=2 Tax=Escherichia coli TaxID=562 RepID=UPI0028A5600F|nr:hypothetical protein [Escherichia coli]MDT3842797.1 hypothetical protein [Escherichia coli]